MKFKFTHAVIQIGDKYPVSGKPENDLIVALAISKDRCVLSGHRKDFNGLTKIVELKAPIIIEINL